MTPCMHGAQNQTAAVARALSEMASAHGMGSPEERAELLRTAEVLEGSEGDWRAFGARCAAAHGVARAKPIAFEEWRKVRAALARGAA